MREPDARARAPNPPAPRQESRSNLCHIDTIKQSFYTYVSLSPLLMKKLLPLIVILAIGGGAYWYFNRPITELQLTGIVTTNDLMVGPQIGGRIDKLLVNEGDAV